MHNIIVLYEWINTSCTSIALNFIELSGEHDAISKNLSSLSTKGYSFKLPKCIKRVSTYITHNVCKTKNELTFEFSLRVDSKKNVLNCTFFRSPQVFY